MMNSAKRRILLSSIIFISLSGTFSIEAQDTEAIELERVVFSSEDPVEVNRALISKAEIYKKEGRFVEASATLSRVRMYLLQGDETAEVLYEKELCSYLSGDFSQAQAFLDEAGYPERDNADALLLDALVLACSRRWDDSKARAIEFAGRTANGTELNKMLSELDRLYRHTPRKRSPVGGMIAAFLPPIGHIYAGKPAEGLLSMALNAVPAAAGVWNFSQGLWLTAFLGGGMGLNYTYMGNQERVAYLIEKYNRDSLIEFCENLKKIFANFAAGNNSL